MRISLEMSSGNFSIHGYAPGEIHVRGPSGGDPDKDVEVFRRSLIISPDRLMADWPPQHFDELEHAHFGTLADFQPEVVLFGSGDRLRLPSPPLLSALIGLRVGYEVMDTGAACRTYNILAAEGRRVVAALLIG